MVNNYRLSKGLSYLLRHGALKHNLNISSDGYVSMEDIIKLEKFKEYKLEDFENVVKSNDKQRFSMKNENEKWYIRANQGHSHNVASKINQEELLTKLDKALPLVVHGTTYEAFESIRKTGLKKMSRMHIHFAINDDFIEGNKNQSGVRNNSQILIYIDMEKAMNDGIEFYISENKVVLSAGLGGEGLIDKKYFKKVISKKDEILEI